MKTFRVSKVLCNFVAPKKDLHVGRNKGIYYR